MRPNCSPISMSSERMLMPIVLSTTPVNNMPTAEPTAIGERPKASMAAMFQASLSTRGEGDRDLAQRERPGKGHGHVQFVLEDRVGRDEGDVSVNHQRPQTVHSGHVAAVADGP